MGKREQRLEQPRPNNGSVTQGTSFFLKSTDLTSLLCIGFTCHFLICILSFNKQDYGSSSGSPYA